MHPFVTEGGWKSRLRYAATSILAIVPCLWLPRIEAGDLGSHLYNAWLVQVVAARRAPGLAIVHPHTNVLFDWLLSATVPALGPDAAAKLVVSAIALLFFWSAFGCVAALSGRKPWPSAPVLLVLTYGWVFHAGFFNFYAAAGLSLAALAVWINGTARALAPLLLLIAWLGNPLPVVFAIAVGAYRASYRIQKPRPYVLLAACALFIGLGAFLLSRAFPSQWSPIQLLYSTGADQLWVYGKRYMIFAAGLLGFWIYSLARSRGANRLCVHLAALAALACLCLPNGVLLPGYHHALAYIPQRLSLFTAIFLVAACNRRSSGASAGCAALLAAGYFCLLFQDSRMLNRTEDALDAAVAKLAPESRVVAAFDSGGSLINPFTHMLDRACIGRCFSYGNYEPSTWQFRLRATGPNEYVADLHSASLAIQRGTYVISPRDPALIAITTCAAEADRFCAAVGATNERVPLVSIPF